jgi:ferritin-like metal-binding protein YciE
VFEILDKSPRAEHCKAMEGLIEEGADLLEEEGDDAVKDAALIGAAQRVEHYEIAAYGTTRTLAELLGLDKAVTLLQQTLDEERETDEKLTELAKSEVNVEASEAK